MRWASPVGVGGLDLARLDSGRERLGEHREAVGGDGLAPTPPAKGLAALEQADALKLLRAHATDDRRLVAFYRPHRTAKGES